MRATKGSFKLIGIKVNKSFTNYTIIEGNIICIILFKTIIPPLFKSRKTALLFGQIE